MHLLGTVTRLQIQRSSLKIGLPQERRYSPRPIQAVSELCVSPGGVTAPDTSGTPLVDVHHRDHPETKQSRRGVNAISVGFSAHYETMRRRFGEHLTDGIAGENVLVSTERPVAESDLARGLVITTTDGEAHLLLENLLVAEPCVEFTRYALRYPPDARSDETLLAALDFLRGGMRGFYATYRGEPVTVRSGDRVYLPRD